MSQFRIFVQFALAWVSRLTTTASAVATTGSLAHSVASRERALCYRAPGPGVLEILNSLARVVFCHANSYSP